MGEGQHLTFRLDDSPSFSTLGAAVLLAAAANRIQSNGNGCLELALEGSEVPASTLGAGAGLPAKLTVLGDAFVAALCIGGHCEGEAGEGLGGVVDHCFGVLRGWCKRRNWPKTAKSVGTYKVNLYVN